MWSKYDYLVFHSNDVTLINISIISNPLYVYTIDELYAKALCWIISGKILDSSSTIKKESAIRDEICKAISTEIVRRLRLRGIFLFDSEFLIDEYRFAHEENNRQGIEAKKYYRDKNLLRSLVHILPLCFNNYDLFLRIIGAHNFESFIKDIKKTTTKPFMNLSKKCKKNLEEIIPMTFYL